MAETPDRLDKSTSNKKNYVSFDQSLNKLNSLGSPSANTQATTEEQ